MYLLLNERPNDLNIDFINEKIGKKNFKKNKS